MTEWVPWRHTVSGLDTAPPPIDDMSVEVTGDTSTVSWGHADATPIIAGYEIREAFEKGIRNWDRGISTVGRVPSESRSKTVPTTGGTFMIKPFDVFGNYAATAVFVDAPTSTPAIPQKEITNIAENPTFGGTKTGTTVRNSTLQLARVPAVGSNPPIDDLPPIDDWAPLDERRSESVQETGTYDTPIRDLSDIYSVIVEAQVRLAGSSSISNFMANVQRMSDLKNFVGDASEDSTRVAVSVRFAETRTGTAGNYTYNWLGGGWTPLSRARITGRFFQMRLTLTTSDPFVTPIVEKVSMQISADQRAQAGRGILTPASAGGNVVFPVPYQQTSVAGDDVTVIPAFSATNTNLQEGDRIEVTNVGAKGFTVAALNASGTNVARYIDYIAEGFGTEVDPTP